LLPLFHEAVVFLPKSFQVQTVIAWKIGNWVFDRSEVEGVAGFMVGRFSLF
jgi:hypothetical protein